MMKDVFLNDLLVQHQHQQQQQRQQQQQNYNNKKLQQHQQQQRLKGRDQKFSWTSERIFSFLYRLFGVFCPSLSKKWPLEGLRALKLAPCSKIRN